MKKGLGRLRWLKLLLMGTAATGIAFGQRAAGQSSDEAAWLQAKSLGTIQAYEDYLNSNPNGVFAQEAFRCVVELSVGLPRSICATEPAGGPDGAGATRSLVDMY